MNVAERVVTLPEDLAGADAWELLPDLRDMLGHQVRVTIEDLDTRAAEECICDPHGDCDEMCLACEDEPSCLGVR